MLILTAMNNYMKKAVQSFIHDETAQGMVEYILIATLMMLVGYIAAQGFIGGFDSYFAKVAKTRAGTIGVGP